MLQIFVLSHSSFENIFNLYFVCKKVKSFNDDDADLSAPLYTLIYTFQQKFCKCQLVREEVFKNVSKEMKESSTQIKILD